MQPNYTVLFNASTEMKETVFTYIRSDQIGSVAQSCPTLCDPMNRSIPGLPVHHQIPEFIRLTSIESVMPSSHLILCRPLLLLPPIPPSIRVFSNESTLRMRLPKYWSFSFSIIPSKEIPGLIPTALTRRTFVGKEMSLLLNMLSRLVITFLLLAKTYYTDQAHGLRWWK